MPELLTAEIANEYRILAENLPENGRQDTGERRELRQELQRRCGLSELQAINILNVDGKMLILIARAKH